MPVLKANRDKDIVQITLPSTEKLSLEDQAWVKLDKTGMTTAEVLALSDSSDGSNGVMVAIDMLTKRIVEWNFTDEQGMAVPITADTVEILDIRDFVALQEALADILPKNSLMGEIQKKS